jgi:hypothetical protein
MIALIVLLIARFYLNGHLGLRRGASIGELALYLLCASGRSIVDQFSLVEAVDGVGRRFVGAQAQVVLNISARLPRQEFGEARGLGPLGP